MFRGVNPFYELNAADVIALFKKKDAKHLQNLWEGDNWARFSLSLIEDFNGRMVLTVIPVNLFV